MTTAEIEPQSAKPAMANVNDSARRNSGQQNVRFASKNGEIALSQVTNSPLDQLPPLEREVTEPTSSEAGGDIRDLSIKLQKSRLQETRMRHFAFEPVSFPPTRVSGVVCIGLACLGLELAFKATSTSANTFV